MRTDKPLTLYWLANDLMWVIYRIHNKDSMGTIMLGLESCDKYLVDLDAPLPIHLQLSTIKSLLQGGYIMDMLKAIQDLKVLIHNDLKEQEPDFRKNFGYRRDKRFD